MSGPITNHMIYNLHLAQMLGLQSFLPPLTSLQCLGGDCGTGTFPGCRLAQMPLKRRWKRIVLDVEGCRLQPLYRNRRKDLIGYVLHTALEEVLSYGGSSIG